MLYQNCPILTANNQNPSNTAVILENEKISFSMLENEIQKILARLSSYHLKPEDVVAISLTVSVKTICTIFAILRLGSSICLINPQLNQNLKNEQIKQLQPTFWIDQDFSYLKKINGIPSLIKQAIYLFTSGSTSKPKIATLSLEKLLTNAQNSITLNERDVWLLKLPLHHVGGLGVILRCFIYQAAVSLTQNEPSISHISYVPTQLYRQSPVYKNLKCVLVGGSKINIIPEKLPIVATYGLTEMGSMVLINEKPQIQNNHLFFSHCLPNREIKLAHDGEILVKGSCLFHGYKSSNISLELDLDNGWFHTKDIGLLNHRNAITVIGRKDWQFIYRGENIQPEEIEMYLHQMTEIDQAIVVGKSDPESGHIPIANIIAKDATLNETSVQNFLKEFLPQHKIPKQVLFWNSFPLIGFKTDRKKILETIEKELKTF